MTMEAEIDKSSNNEEKNDVEASTTLQKENPAKQDDKEESKPQEEIKLNVNENSSCIETKEEDSPSVHESKKESSSQGNDESVNENQEGDDELEKKVGNMSLEPNNEESSDLEAALDDDEIEENPAYIPKKGRYYMHDSRDDDGSELLALKKSRADGDWKHDRFDEKNQRPKTKQQLFNKYGFDIRKKEGEGSANEQEEVVEEQSAPVRRNGRHPPRGRSTRGKPNDSQPKQLNGSTNEEDPKIERRRRSDSFRKAGRYSSGREREESIDEDEEQAFQRRQKPQTRVVRNVRGRGGRGIRAPRGGRNGPSARGGRQFEQDYKFRREEQPFEREDGSFYPDERRNERRHIDDERHHVVERRQHDDVRRFEDRRQMDDDKRNRKPRFPEYENHRRGAVRGSVRGGSLRMSGRGFSRTFTNRGTDESRREHIDQAEAPQMFERKSRGNFTSRGSRGQELRVRGPSLRGVVPGRAPTNQMPRGGPPPTGPKRYSQQRNEVFHGQRNEDVVYFDPAVQTKRQPPPPREKKIIEILPPSS